MCTVRYRRALSVRLDIWALVQVLFYLACDAVREAVEVYLEARMHAEAVALARCRLLPEGSSPVEQYTLCVCPMPSLPR